MKKRIFLAAVAVAAVACSSAEKTPTTPVLTDKIVFCEATLPLDGKLLVGSFGSDEFNPLNTEGKGYILEFTDTVSRVLIPADGTLSAPKGLLVKDDYLFIADVGKMAVYNLAAPNEKPKIVPFPEGELFVNDMALHGNTLYVTVTNTGQHLRAERRPAVAARHRGTETLRDGTRSERDRHPGRHDVYRIVSAGRRHHAG